MGTMERARGQWQNRKARKQYRAEFVQESAFDADVRGMIEVRAGGRDRERGASLVEFALVVPLLTLFLFGIVQFGIAYDMKQSINSAAREGARTASIPDNDFAAIQTATRNAFQGLVNDGTVTVRVVNPTLGYDSAAVPASTGAPCLDTNPADTVLAGNVVVTATVPYVLTIPFFGTRNLTLTGRGEFRCERTA